MVSNVVMCPTAGKHHHISFMVSLSGRASIILCPLVSNAATEHPVGWRHKMRPGASNTVTVGAESINILSNVIADDRSKSLAAAQT